MSIATISLNTSYSPSFFGSLVVYKPMTTLVVTTYIREINVIYYIKILPASRYVLIQGVNFFHTNFQEDQLRVYDNNMIIPVWYSFTLIFTASSTKRNKSKALINIKSSVLSIWSIYSNPKFLKSRIKTPQWNCLKRLTRRDPTNSSFTYKRFICSFFRLV